MAEQGDVVAYGQEGGGPVSPARGAGEQSSGGLQQPRPGQFAEFVDALHPGRLQEGIFALPVFLTRRDAQAEGRALQDDPLEQALRFGVSGQGGGGDGAARLAGDRDAVRVATEVRDVVADPAQCGELVREPEVGGPVVGLPVLAEGQVTERSDAVVEGDDDQVAVAREGLAGVDGQRPGARDEATAVDPDQHGPLGVVDRRGPHVERQAVLVERRASVTTQDRVTARQEHLRRAGSVRGCVPSAVPARVRPRGAPPELAHRRRGVRHPFEGDDSPSPAAAPRNRPAGSRTTGETSPDASAMGFLPAGALHDSTAEQMSRNPSVRH